MKKIHKKSLAFLAVMAGCVIMAGCGCGEKKAPDEEATRVMQITIAPEATPTPAPDQISSEAVAKNGNLTMVNLYLAEKKDASAKSGDAKEPADGIDIVNENDTEGTEDGSEE